MINDKSSIKLRWRLGILAGIFLSVFMLFPQFKLIYLRGADWQGNYAYNDIDEVAYAAYVRALIDGRPRKNDPYTGRDDSVETPQPESLFSIQFAAPYTIAVPARVFGLSAPMTMTLAGALAGFMAALAVFWLLGRITGDSWFAFAGSLVVLVGGALAAGEGAVGEVFGFSYAYPYFPAFRRYIPALPFPFFLAMCVLVWLLLHADDARRRLVYAALAAFCFAYTVFSYFYTWTAAAAWLGCVALLWLVVRPEGFRRDLKTLAALGAGCCAALAPYAYLLSKRGETMDNVQLLVRTHAPDLIRVPEFISFAVLLMLALGVLTEVIELKDRATLFAASFALVPLIVFNQQVISGRSLQPIHYQVFIGNYVALLALTVTVGLLARRLLAEKPRYSKLACAGLALLAVVWGFVECHYTVRLLDTANIDRDASMPLGRRLEELARADADPHRATVLHFGFESDDLPTIAPQNVLWARHQHVFAGLGWEESKERYYQFLYYANVDEYQLERQLMQGDFISTIALFGWGRHTNRLSVDATPLTYREAAAEARRYGQYCRNFGLRQASSPTLSYVVVPTSLQVDLTNLDTWYDRDSGERIGSYVLYKVKLKEN
jgi:hypothetical protein